MDSDTQSGSAGPAEEPPSPALPLTASLAFADGFSDCKCTCCEALALENVSIANRESTAFAGHTLALACDFEGGREQATH